MAFNKNPEVITTYIDDLEYESINQSGNKVLIDMYDADKKSNQSPTELLLSAVASCSAVDVVEILKKRRKSFTAFSVKATGNRQEEHPRYFKFINLHFSLKSQDVTVEELEKNAKLVVDKYCSVATTISGVAKLTVSAEVS